MKLHVRIEDNLETILVVEHDSGKGTSEYPVSRLLLESANIASAEEAKVELKDQLQLDYDYGILYAIALDQQRQAERKLDDLTKLLYKEHREKLAQEGKSDPKENQIKAEIVSDARYQEAMDMKLEADKVADTMKFVVIRMLEDRRIVLGKLSQDNAMRTF